MTLGFPPAPPWFQLDYLAFKYSLTEMHWYAKEGDLSIEAPDIFLIWRIMEELGKRVDPEEMRKFGEMAQEYLDNQP